MAKYNDYIEISPNYESVVTLTSEDRNPELWHDYIVHDDMKIAVEKICESIKYENKDARCSFWIHGAYGTGKSYAAIILKHLFEDTTENVGRFLSNQKLLPYREKFLALRKKGEYLVVWESGCSDIVSGTQLMMRMEQAIHKRLAATFGDRAYYGRSSLVSAAQNAINDREINWNEIFNNPAYRLPEEYDTFEDFKKAVLDGDLKATNRVATIQRKRGRGFLSVVEDFENWIKDIIDGNGLKETGIVFIWDEFTSFLRSSGDDNVLQRMSELCKQPDAPFFMCLIVHRDPGWVEKMGGQTYARITHRYHELEFHITGGAAYDMIGGSIRIRDGMTAQWQLVKKRLMESISKNISDFDNLEQSGNNRERMGQLVPLHPMTCQLLVTVAQTFAAQQRTFFRFMKDPQTQDVGFPHYIANFGPDDWRWLTPDFLWDYFFTRRSDVREGEITAEANQAWRHYEQKRGDISDATALHIFKAALLLIAVLSSDRIGHFYSQQSGRKISATKNTLYQCFSGQLLNKDIDKYLDILDSNDWIRLNRQSNGDVRLELPFGVKADEFEVRLKQVKKTYTRYELFKKNGIFSKSLEEKMWEKTKATFNRITVAVCSAEKNSTNIRCSEINNELKKNVWKIGILGIVIPEQGQFNATSDNDAARIALDDRSERLLVCVFREALTEEHLDKWHRAVTHREMAAEAGREGSARQYETEAASVVEEWSSAVSNGPIALFYGDKRYPSLLNGNYDLFLKVEQDVLFNVFSAAPELIVSQNTAFKSANENAALAGITKQVPNHSQQLKNIEDGVKKAEVWDASTLEELEKYDTTLQARAIAELARFIREKLAVGAKVPLDQLWIELQQKPFGYYNCLTCAYLLGFILRFYVDGEFNWNDTANPIPLTKDKMATMIVSICKNDVTNHTLSSGSETWRNFKNYAQKIFGLSNEESANEQQARKYMRERVTKSGTPFWSLKHVMDEKWGGRAAKSGIVPIIDAFCCFLLNNEHDNQESIMAMTVDGFSGKGKLRQILMELTANVNERYSAFKTFIFEHFPDIEESYRELALSDFDLYDALKIRMSEAVYTWTEEDVRVKLAALALEYRLTRVLNDAMGSSCKSAPQIRNVLQHCFAKMIVPGTVIETMKYPWVDALRCMRSFAESGWEGETLERKKENISVLSKDAKTVWEGLNSPKEILAAYMAQRGAQCGEEELNEIISELNFSYNTPESNFWPNLSGKLGNLIVERDKKRLAELWRKNTNYPSITDWCNNHKTPLQWVTTNDALPYIETLKKIQENQRAVTTDLRNAVLFFEKYDFAILKDKARISDCFFAQIGEKYKEIFREYGETIFPRVEKQLGSDVWSWALKSGEIRGIADEFFVEENRKKYEMDARKRVMTMSEKDLKARVLQVLEQHPELYKRFVD